MTSELGLKGNIRAKVFNLRFVSDSRFSNLIEPPIVGIRPALTDDAQRILKEIRNQNSRNLKDEISVKKIRLNERSFIRIDITSSF